MTPILKLNSRLVFGIAGYFGMFDRHGPCASLPHSFRLLDPKKPSSTYIWQGYRFCLRAALLHLLFSDQKHRETIPPAQQGLPMHSPPRIVLVKQTTVSLGSRCNGVALCCLIMNRKFVIENIQCGAAWLLRRSDRTRERALPAKAWACSASHRAMVVMYECCVHEIASSWDAIGADREAWTVRHPMAGRKIIATRASPAICILMQALHEGLGLRPLCMCSNGKGVTNQLLFDR